MAFDIIALRKIKKLGLRLVGGLKIMTETFIYGFTTQSDFFHKDDQASLRTATGLDLPWGDANVQLKKEIGLIGTKEMVEKQKTKLRNWAVISTPIEVFLKAMFDADEKLAVKMMSQLLDRYTFDQAIGTVNWSITQLVYAVRERSGKKHFQEIWPDQLLAGMVEALPLLNRKQIAQKLAANSQLRNIINIELLKSMMSVPASKLAAGIHDKDFKAAGDRYFTHIPCGANERMPAMDFAKFKDGLAVTLRCPKCFYEGVISYKTEAANIKLVVTKESEKATVAAPAQIKAFVPAEGSHLKPVPREEQERRAQTYVKVCVVGEALSV